MQIESNYEINVWKYDENELYHVHVCKIELGSHPIKRINDVFKELRNIFPDNYHLDLYKVDCSSYKINT